MPPLTEAMDDHGEARRLNPTRRELLTIASNPHPEPAREPHQKQGRLMTRTARALSRLRHATGAIVVVGLLAAGVAGCGSGGTTENTGEPGIPAPTAQEEAQVGTESAEQNVAGSKQEAAELLEQTKEKANQVIEEAEQQAFETVQEAKADKSLSKDELKEAKEEAKEALLEAKESAKKALEGAKAKAEEIGG
jgi:F0F1-type ATP synthase membrane subunit b/b'